MIIKACLDSLFRERYFRFDDYSQRHVQGHFPMTGWRIGYLGAPPEIAAAIKKDTRPFHIESRFHQPNGGFGGIKDGGG